MFRVREVTLYGSQGYVVVRGGGDIGKALWGRHYFSLALKDYSTSMGEIRKGHSRQRKEPERLSLSLNILETVKPPHHPPQMRFEVTRDFSAVSQ